MSKCTKCSKRIGLISIRYKCRQCKRIFCSNCMAKVNIPSEMIPLFELINEFEKPEYSLTKITIIGEIWKSRAKLLRNRLFEKIVSVTG